MNQMEVGTVPQRAGLRTGLNSTPLYRILVVIPVRTQLNLGQYRYDYGATTLLVLALL